LFRIIFSIYSGRQRYSLIKVKSNEAPHNLNAYRIFTHQRHFAGAF
jgi:hypothetical protein